MRKLIVTPAAALELREAAVWYSDRERGLGEELVGEIDRTLEKLVEGAHRYPIWRTGRPYQKAPVQRFPYVVFYVEAADEVRVLAIAHRKRKPGYWLRREK